MYYMIIHMLNIIRNVFAATYNILQARQVS